MKYTARLTGESLLLFEMQKTAQLIKEGKTMTESKKEIIDNNIYQYERPTTVSRRFPFIWRRLNIINKNGGIDLFLNDSDDAKVLALYTIYKDNNFFETIIQKIIGEKIINKEYDLYKNSIINLFPKMEENDLAVKKWTQKTRDKLCQVALKILKETGLLKDDRLTPLYISYNIKKYLEEMPGGIDFISYIS